MYTRKYRRVRRRCWEAPRVALPGAADAAGTQPYPAHFNASCISLHSSICRFLLLINHLFLQVIHPLIAFQVITNGAQSLFWSKRPCHPLLNIMNNKPKMSHHDSLSFCNLKKMGDLLWQFTNWLDLVLWFVKFGTTTCIFYVNQKITQKSTPKSKKGKSLTPKNCDLHSTRFFLFRLFSVTEIKRN